jgi:hypothetical protein
VILYCALAAAADQKAVSVSKYGSFPPSFEINRGQTDSRVKFLSRGRGYTIFLTPREAVLAVSDGSHSQALQMSLAGSNREPSISGLHQLPGKSNYFVGNDPRKWRSNIPLYSEVLFRQVYPKIDLLYHTNQKQLEFDFRVAPHADPNLIELNLAGARELRVNDEGDLVASIDGGEIRFDPPQLYQIERTPSRGEKRIALHDAAYVVTGTRIKFRLPAYDSGKMLVIDPVAGYSTLLGGNGDSFGNAIAVDSAGHAYVAGGTTSSDFPITAGSFQTTYAGDNGFGYQGVVGDAFVTKLNASGTGVMYSTYIGGSGGDDAYGIALDAAGNAYLTGGTNSADFPETAGAWQGSCCGLTDVFVTKLNATGSALVYSTHIGVEGEGTRGFGIAIDSAGSAYVTGNAGPGFPTTPGALKTECNCFTDGYVFKLDPTGASAIYSTFVGGSSVEYGEAIAVDNSGRAWVTGYSASSDFPTTANAFQLTNKGGVDGFVSVLNPAGSRLNYSTLLGGSGDEEGYKIAVNSGKAYLTGYTSSTDFPVTAGAFQTRFGGGNSDAFIAKIDPTKSGSASLVYGTFLGGNGDENLSNFQRDILSVDSSGNVYVTGATTSPNFPLLHALQASAQGGWDAYVSVLNSTGSQLRFSTYLGGSNDDFGRGIAFRNGAVYLTGQTYSQNFPTTRGAFQRSFKGTSDAFVTKIGP